MTLTEFEEYITTNSIAVTYFSHDKCNVCKILKPQVQEIVGEFNGIDFLYINIKESPEISGQFMVFAVPTIILFLRAVRQIVIVGIFPSRILNHSLPG